MTIHACKISKLSISEIKRDGERALRDVIATVWWVHISIGECCEEDDSLNYSFIGRWTKKVIEFYAIPSLTMIFRYFGAENKICTAATI